MPPTCDAAHITQPQRETMQICMEQSLKMAGLSARDIGYISAHGTATDRGDIAESQATAAIYGENVPISSLKSYFGHTLGACGALEAWMSLQMMREGWFCPHAQFTPAGCAVRCAGLHHRRSAPA
ncbi:3-oxoacyl-[acyl-carrier-protein] synthase 1 [Kluyvera cryocrescens]|uniref:3-oxoacyl-[acyl-carrier-protein] synthase 1 n=1 Tax=Kluyvera cryocrescens TaxID=580 RepID=A0A485CGJ4_KLUCR|nr:3-oxoacyl-[acyl-carrier-protein] synthase 1 [Kluyvera cryocrescens]